MPTFLLFKNGNKVGEVVGANPQGLNVSSVFSVAPRPLIEAGFCRNFSARRYNRARLGVLLRRLALISRIQHERSVFCMWI